MCCKCAQPKRDFRTALKFTLKKEMGIEISKFETDLEEDPFLKLGFGINAYFDLILNLARLTAFISIVFLPVLGIYSSYDFSHGKPMASLN